MNDRQYLAALESANTDQLCELLRQSSREKKRVLALYFGDERLARLRRLVLATRLRGPKRGKVVVLHVVRPAGVLKKWYSEMLVGLAADPQLTPRSVGAPRITLRRIKPTTPKNINSL